MARAGVGVDWKSRNCGKVPVMEICSAKTGIAPGEPQISKFLRVHVDHP